MTLEGIPCLNGSTLQRIERNLPPRGMPRLPSPTRAASRLNLSQNSPSVLTLTALARKTTLTGGSARNFNRVLGNGQSGTHTAFRQNVLESSSLITRPRRLPRARVYSIDSNREDGHDSHLNRKTMIEDTVIIDKPISTVFNFYKDFTNLPKFLGDVLSIQYTGPKTSKWTIDVPLGVKDVETHWTATTTEEVQNQHIFYQTGPSWYTNRWQVYFTDGPKLGQQTTVREVMLEPYSTVTNAVLTMIGKHPEKEVHHNLNRLKQYLETGKVTDMENAVPGKFDRQA